ncbi:MAG: SBBP repeat-containing protein, partial [Anaerolineae bacterium]
APQPPSPNLGEAGAFRPSPRLGRGAGGEGHEGQPRKGVNLRLTFPGANPHPRIEPFDRLDTVVSYFIGNDPDQWHPDVPVWGGVHYVDIYPGVDLELTSEGGQYTQRLVTRAGADLSAVRLRVEGADTLALDDAGYLRLTTAVGDFTLPLLAIEGAVPNSQPASFNLERGTFEVSSPFSSALLLPRSLAPLQDNPDDLLYSTFLGGSARDYGVAIAVDETGCAYVSGGIQSADFPTTAGAFDTSYNGYSDAFVVKLNADGTGLVYATFLGGSSDDSVFAISVDGVGSAYAAGSTNSSDFPTTAGVFDTSHNGSYDAFVVKLNADETLNENNVKSLTSRVSSLRMLRPLGKTGQDDYGLDTPNAVVTVQTRDEEGNTKSYTIRVGAKSDEDNSYVVISSESPYYVRVSEYTVKDFVEKVRDDFLELPPTPTPEETS